MNYDKINGIDYLFIENKKFKTNTISICFKEKTTKENCLKRFALVELLKEKTSINNSKLKLTRKLQELYCSFLNVKETTKGEYSTLKFSITYIKDEYLTTDLTSEVVKLLHEVIYNPYLENNCFDNKSLNKIKDEFINLINKKNQSFLLIAKENALFELYENQSITNRLYKKEDIEKLNVKDIYDYYLSVLKTNNIFIVVEGAKNIKEHFNIFNSNNSDLINYERTNLSSINKGNVIIKKNTKQTSLFSVYDNLSDNIYKNIVFSTLLGDSASSFLFREVREKHSLAYSIRSSYDADYNNLFITGGIKQNSSSLTIKIINEIINKLKTFKNDVLLQNIIDALTSSIIESFDYTGTLSNFAITNWEKQRTLSIDEYINNLRSVTVNDINEIAKNLTHKITYLIEGENDEEN